MLSIHGSQAGQSVGVIGIIELVANRSSFVSKTLIQFLGALLLQTNIILVAVSLFVLVM